MPNSRIARRRSSAGALLAFAAALVLTGASSSPAEAQLQPKGFALERFYASAPGGGWMVMDDLDLHGGLGGALAFTTGYAHNPLRITSADGSQHLALVRHQAFADFGAAITYDRLRLYFNASSPIVVQGESGTIDGYRFAPGQDPDNRQNCGQKRVCVDPGWNPDTISDARVGFDARLFGDPKGPFRLGVGAQLFVQSGAREDYVTDGTWRSMNRLLFAGNLGRFAYAGQLGVHFRPLNDGPVPGSPRGSELLFGLAAGPRLPLGSDGRWAFVAGPEIYGVTAFRSLFDAKATGVEGLLTGRLEGARKRGSQLRIKLGGGGGLAPQFGAPEWRFVFAIEMFDRGK